MERIWTILDLIKWGQEYFSQKNISSPRLNIEMLLSNVLNLSRIELYLKYDKPLAEKELEKLRGFVKRRAKKEPLQYIFGQTEFCDIHLKTDKRALIPRPETEILVQETIKFLESIKKEKLNILEIGTGTGCISLSILKKFPNSKIIATDISQDALDLAYQNFNINFNHQEYSNQTDEKFKFDIEFIQNNILDERDFTKLIDEIEEIDLLISNPPYIPSDKMKDLEVDILEYEPQNALTDRADGLTFYKRFKEIFLDKKFTGKMYLEIDGRNSEDLLNIFSSQLFKTDILKDFSDLDRILIVSKVKN